MIEHLIHTCKSTLRHMHDCNLRNEAVNCSEMLVRFCILLRQTISGHSFSPFRPHSVILHSVICFISPEDENSVFSRCRVIDFIWNGDGNISKTCQWSWFVNLICHMSVIYILRHCQNYMLQFISIVQDTLYCVLFVPLTRSFSVILLMCTALISLLRPVSMILFSVFCFTFLVQASFCDTV